MLNTATLAPRPKPRVSTAVSVKPGVLRSVRRQYVRSDTRRAIGYWLLVASWEAGSHLVRAGFGSVLLLPGCDQRCKISELHLAAVTKHGERFQHAVLDRCQSARRGDVHRPDGNGRREHARRCLLSVSITRYELADAGDIALVRADAADVAGGIVLEVAGSAFRTPDAADDGIVHMVGRSASHEYVAAPSRGRKAQARDRHAEAIPLLKLWERGIPDVTTDHGAAAHAEGVEQMRDVGVVVAAAFVRVRVDRNAHVVAQVAEYVQSVGGGRYARVFIEQGREEHVPIRLQRPPHVVAASQRRHLDQPRSQRKVVGPIRCRPEHSRRSVVLDVGEEDDVDWRCRGRAGRIGGGGRRAGSARQEGAQCGGQRYARKRGDGVRHPLQLLAVSDTSQPVISVTKWNWGRGSLEPGWPNASTRSSYS